LRSEPNLDAEQIGGVSYNQQVVVLKSADKFGSGFAWKIANKKVGSKQVIRIEPEE